MDLIAKLSIRAASAIRSMTRLSRWATELYAFSSSAMTRCNHSVLGLYVQRRFHCVFASHWLESETQDVGAAAIGIACEFASIQSILVSGFRFPIVICGLPRWSPRNGDLLMSLRPPLRSDSRLSEWHVSQSRAVPDSPALASDSRGGSIV